MLIMHALGKTGIAHVLLLVLFSPAMPLLAADSVKDSDEIVFGMLPFLSTEKLFTRFTPLADYLSKKLDKPVRMETAKNFDTFLYRASKERRYDLLYTAPHFYHHAQRKANYRAIVRVGISELRAVIVVPGNSSIQNLSDLKGKSMATTDPLALATMMVREHLTKAAIDPDREINLVATPNHNASVLLAYKGITDAAALMYFPFRLMSPEIQQAMRVIATTDGSPHIPIAVAASMDKQLAEQIKTVLLEINNDEEGSALLKSMRIPGFVVAEPDLYDGLEWASKQLE